VGSNPTLVTIVLPVECIPLPVEEDGGTGRIPTF
jgi:hypothetical protein